MLIRGVLMRDVVALVLAGGVVREMGVLLRRRSKAALPFGGMYRVIDFPLTNLSRSNVPVVGILSQYRPRSLMDHVGVGRPWDYNQRTRELIFLPPQQGLGPSDWYRGTADAVYQNIPFLERYVPRHVMILSGDHVYLMDYRPVFEFHLERDADLTMVFKPMPVSSPCRFGIGVLDSDGRVIDYEEKPLKPRSNLASLTIYIFKYDVLIEEVKRNAREGRSHHLYDEVIPRMVAQGRRVYGYVFDGPWKYLRDPLEYLEEHIALATDSTDLALSDAGVITNLEVLGVGDAPPSRVEGDVKDVLVAPGSIIRGEVRRSVLGPWVRVEEGVRIEDSVIFGNAVIKSGVVIRRAIIDKGVVVEEGAGIDGGDRVAVIGRKRHVSRREELGPGEHA